MRLDALSCPAAGSCVAVGGYQDSSRSFHGLIETLSNGTWSAAMLPTSGLSPAVGPGGLILRTVSCPAGDWCAATGNYPDSSGAQQQLLAILAGGSWTASTAPLTGLNPPPASNPLATLSSLACPAAGSCVAAGYYAEASAHEDGLIETLNHGTWTATTAPTAGLSPAPGIGVGGSVHLTSLFCSGVGACVAAGLYDASGHGHGLAETLSGRSWSAATMPTAGLTPIAQSVNSVTGVSCPAAGSCAAIGTYQDVSGIEHGMLGTLAGGTWTAKTAPITGLNPPPIYTADPTQPPDTVPVTLASVACPANGSCVVAGYYEDPAKSLHGLIETLSDAPVRAPGYWLSTSAGRVYSFNAPSYASAASSKVVGIAADGPGYLLATSSGTVSSVNAPSFGSFSGTLPSPVAGIAADKATEGYWLTTRAGNVYNFNAPWYGSKASTKLPAPIVGITADGAGYLLVTRAGNVYAFHTPWYGSKAGTKLPAPIAGIVADPATRGYWLVTSAGNVYNFNAPWYGSKASTKLPAPIVGITADGNGYLLASAAGNVYAFNTPRYGSLAGTTLAAPVTGLTVAG